MTTSNQTINLNVDPNAIPKTTSFANELISSYVKQTFTGWKDERLKNFRPLSSFLNRDNISLPKVTEVPKRISRNLTYYQTNYIVVFLLLSLYGALTNPTFLLVLLLVGFGWYLLFKKRTGPLKIKNWQVPESLVTILFCMVTIGIFYLASAGTVLFWIFSISITIVLAHALLCTPPEIDEFGFGLPTSVPPPPSITSTSSSTLPSQNST